jgi:hypothetical protein
MSEIVKAETQSLALSQQEKETRLTERELREYRIYMRLNQPSMAKSTQEQFFNLFLTGVNCEEIVKLNPGGFSLGAIVRARIENDWDEKRQEHQITLMERARERIQQVTLETVERILLEISASNKLTTDKVLKFIQTGDEKELDGTSVGNIRHLKEMVEMLQKLTGQDVKKQQQNVSGTVVHNHVVASQPSVPSSELPVLPSGKPIAPGDAANVLELIRRNRQAKG